MQRKESYSNQWNNGKMQVFLEFRGVFFRDVSFDEQKMIHNPKWFIILKYYYFIPQTRCVNMYKIRLNFPNIFYFLPKNLLTPWQLSLSQ